MKALAAAVLMVIVSASGATAQTWQGFYIGGHIGGAIQMDDSDETVEFDTNLDGTFTDIVRTAAGVNAFTPGFCGGFATGATPASACTEDEDGFDFGGRAGYDWQRGGLMFGAVAELSRPDVIDGVSAFSTTPAFYGFERQLKSLLGLRARVGAGSERVVAYATGGYAWGWVDQFFSSSNTVNTFVAVNQDGEDGSKQGVSGYQAGGGVEFKFAERLSVMAEYMFTNLDDRDNSIIRAQGPAPATNPFILTNASGTDLRRTDAFQLHSVKVGLNVRF